MRLEVTFFWFACWPFGMSRSWLGAAARCFCSRYRFFILFFGWRRSGWLFIGLVLKWRYVGSIMLIWLSSLLFIQMLRRLCQFSLINFWWIRCVTLWASLFFHLRLRTPFISTLWRLLWRRRLRLLSTFRIQIQSLISPYLWWTCQLLIGSRRLHSCTKLSHLHL